MLEWGGKMGYYSGEEQNRVGADLIVRKFFSLCGECKKDETNSGLENAPLRLNEGW